MMRYGLVCAPSVQAASRFEDEFFDFVYIDADHSYEAVRADLEVWWPKLKPGGLFAGHDYDLKFSGVKTAVDEFAQRAGLEVQQTSPEKERMYGRFSRLSWWFLK